MFTGIIETIGEVKEITSNGTNKSFWIESSLFSDLKVDQSIAHNGVCLTIEELSNGFHQVTAVKETLDKTNLSHWSIGSHINLERSLLPSSRLDGHFVQGHVDCVGICKKVKNEDGSWQLEFKFPGKFASLMIEKGSICLDGISLTAFDVKKNSFKVAVIPYTWEHTNLRYLKTDDLVNLEFDLIGKYITRKLILNNK
jgi:riboflavin synthase